MCVFGVCYVCSKWASGKWVGVVMGRSGFCECKLMPVFVLAQHCSNDLCV